MPDETLNPEEIRALLADPHYAIVTTLGRDGYPHTTPVWYLPEPEGTLTFLIEPQSVKARNIRRNPRISVLVTRNGPPDMWVMLRGEAEIDDSDLEDQMLRVSQRYQGEKAGAEYAAAWSRPLNFIAVTIRAPRVTAWKSVL